MRVIANTTPLRYLVLIDHQFILPRLYERILIPPSAPQELQHPRTPPAVHRCMTALPEWVEATWAGALIGLVEAGAGGLILGNLEAACASVRRPRETAEDRRCSL